MIKLFEIILIETCNVCTRTCWFCKFGQERKYEKKQKMSWKTIERIVFNLRDLKYTGRISWFWINEPLVDKRIFNILDFTRENCPRAFLTLNTNGDLLTTDVYRRLLDSGLDALGVSIYDDETLQEIERMEKDSRLVMLNMRDPTFAGIDNRGGNIKQSVQYFEEHQLEYIDRSCGRPFRMMTINVKGHVALCCSDLYSDVVMGDVHQDRLEAIWRNAKFNHYRDTLNKSGRRNLELCSTCSFHGGIPNVFYPLTRE